MVGHDWAVKSRVSKSAAPLRPEDTHGARALYISDPALASGEVRAIVEQKSKYDLDRDGVLDERELQLAMEEEAKSRWAGMNELFSTHPPTFRRILLLREIEKEMRTGSYGPQSIYRHI